jgi:hypothetical protein
MKPVIPYIPNVMPPNTKGVEHGPLVLLLAVVITAVVMGLIYYILERKA